jgi:O-methyltransferase involved in polyketide biosynthesis
MARPHPETISPTAHYTGYVWFAHGYSHAAFATTTGRAMYTALRPANAIASATGLPSLEGMLLARHRLIDLRLAHAIEHGGISQVVEVATGLSPRGWRFARAYGDKLTYVEADLPGMLANKRRILNALGGESPHHRTQEVDALADTGPTSIDAICAGLDPTRGTAIITEGLVNYFDQQTVLGIWRRFATALRRFPAGTYYSDLVLGGANRGPIVTGFSWALSAFVRGKVHMHFDGAADAIAALRTCGFTRAELLEPATFASELPGVETAGARRVTIVEAAI